MLMVPSTSGSSASPSPMTGKVDNLKRLEDAGIAAIVYTDIARDGMHTGPNLDSTRRLCQSVNAPVIAAGGVHNIEDVRRLKEMEPLGLAGFITGRAIYEGTLDLAEAIALAQAD